MKYIPLDVKQPSIKPINKLINEYFKNYLSIKTTDRQIINAYGFKLFSLLYAMVITLSYMLRYGVNYMSDRLHSNHEKSIIIYKS